MKATIRNTNDPELQRVFVGHWAFPTLDFGFMAPKTARKVKRLFDAGRLDEAVKAAQS